MLIKVVFELKDCLKKSYDIIDAPRLLMLDYENLRVLLEKVVDKNKVPKSYNPYYSWRLYVSEKFLNFSQNSSIDLSELKEEYIENFIASIEFYKKMNNLRIIKNTIGIVKVGDQYGDKHLETEFVDAIRKELKKTKNNKRS